MATSGSKNYSITAIEIIGGALRKLGAYDHGEPIPAEEVQDAMQALNLLTKEWASYNLDIWVRNEVTLTLSGKTKYIFGPGGEEVGVDVPPDWTTTLLYDVDAGETAFAAADPSLITSAFVNDGTATIQLDDGTLFTAKVVNGVVSNGVQYYILETGVTSAASAGNYVINSYETTPYVTSVYFDKPIHLLYAARRNTDTGQDVPVNIIGEVEYQRLSQKDRTGPVTNVWFKPLKDTTELYVWPTGDDTFDQLVLQMRFHVDDFDSTTDNPEFPVEWANALIFNLAHDLAPEYGVSKDKRAEMYLIGQGKLNNLLDNNQENANVTFTIEQRVR